MILGLAILLFANLKGALFGGSARYVRGRLLTRNEKDFLAVLDEALAATTVYLCKCALRNLSR